MGHSGQGIETVSEGELPDAPLYTKRAKRKAEYRVHVLRGTIIDIQQKKRRNGSDRGALVWNHGTGYVYCREGVECPDNVKNTAILAVASLGLDFGAVDMILSKQDEALVLEVNTAPGLVGTTISKYKEAFNGVLSHV
jgi:glutathione synthase/RimK-type ligase-like ATP-grasp enzyme